MLDSPEIPDAEYDLLVVELRQLEAEHPDLVDARLADADGRGRRRRASSPRCATGCPMMSLDNAFDEAELLAWAERLRRQDPRPRPERARLLE